MASRAHLSLLSRIDTVELVQQMLEETLAGLPTPGSAPEIAIAVGEAVANAVRHGNGGDPGKRVVVDLEVDGEELLVRVSDEGAGFDPRQIRDPLAEQNLLDPQGRGIFFMRRLMDQIEYTFDAEGGTIVTLRKRIGEAVERVSEEEKRV